MPALSAWSRRHKALLWEFDGGYSEDGRPTVSPPVEIMVRWDDNSKIMTGPNRQPITVDSTVVVGQPIDLQSLMWLAPDQTPMSETAMNQWYDTGSAGNQTGLMEVVADSSGLDLKSRQSRLVVGLMPYKDRLP